MRNPPNVNRLNYVKFFGVKYAISPISKKEMVEAGFKILEPNPNYVQDEKKFNPFQKAAIFIKSSHLMINGETGTGKDEFVKNLALATNTPFASFNFNSSGDATGWISRLGLTKKDGVTQSEEIDGALKRASQGVTIVRHLDCFKVEGEDKPLGDEEIQELIAEMEDNRWTVQQYKDQLVINIPAIVLVCDADRASFEQAEALRQATEQDREQLTHPITGEMFPVAKNTRFIYTSNSGVDGDGGRGMITNRKDTSMTNRMSGVYIPHPSREFETKIYQKSYPDADPEHIATLVNCTVALRKACREENLALDVSIRQGLMWMKHTREFQENYGVGHYVAFKEAFSFITGHLMERPNRAMFESAIAGFLPTEDTNPKADKSKAQSSPCPIDSI